MIKTFKSQKPYYDNSKWAHDTDYDGLDCLPRSLQVQEVTNFDINFGIILIKSKLHDGSTSAAVKWGWSIPFGMHLWNENNDTIFDLEESFQMAGYDLSGVQKVELITPPKFKDPFDFDRWLSKTCRSMALKSKVDVVYIEGVGVDRQGHLLDWVDINELIDEIDEEFSITGETSNDIIVESFV